MPTFESIGVYWTPPSNPGDGCPVIFRKVGDSNWRQGLDMWYDARNSECRGSLVLLEPGTTYEVQLGMPGQAPSAGLMVTTWSEQFPIAQTITLPAGARAQPLTITQGGTPNGYILYQADPASGTTIDVQNAYANNVTISAPYVIVRGFTLKGAQQSAIQTVDGAHDVVIENNDISGWGRFNYTNSSGWQIGVDYDAGVYAKCYNATTPAYRLIIQRNKIHDPRYGANSWDWGHPAGPQGITLSYCAGNHVVRYNEVWSSDMQHYFNDGIGGEVQESDAGFPGYDSDIYGNIVKNAWDDAIEAEGGMRNVRIWNNYIDQATVGIATATVNGGPAYIFRNVQNRSRQLALRPLDSDDRNTFAKSGRASTFGGGRRYFFHNTLLQATDASAQYTLGAGNGISNSLVTNSVSRNNILHIWKSWWASIDISGGSADDFDYDLYNGNIIANPGAETNGIVGTPIYASGNGWASESGGMYQLAPSSPGYRQGVRIPNFNDMYTAPDIGAHQSGTPAMKFGVTGSR